MKKLIGYLVFLFFIGGCASPSQPQVKVMRYTTEIFQPTNKIEVLHTKPVERDYIELGTIAIRLNKSTEENAVAYLTEKGKELGADAIIIMGERSRGAVAIPIGSMAVAVPIKELYAIAIKYK